MNVRDQTGRKTSTLDRFYLSLYGKPLPGLTFFALALVSVSRRCSYPMMVEQVLDSGAEKAEAKQQQANSGKVGRPKGSKNRDKTQVTLIPELGRIQSMGKKLLALVGQVRRLR